MYPLFVYLPPENNKRGRFLNLSLIADIEEFPEKLLLWGSCGEEIASITGEQARHLRAALAGQTRPQPTMEERYPNLSAWAERREPQLPNLPDPVVVPPAVTEFNDKLSARGTVA